jgi:quinol monooxygenase YgiN
MIIVWGCIEAKEGHIDDVLRLSLEHVHRSRTEPGCIAHNVHTDAEQRNRIVFFEEWKDLAALHAHFAVPESKAFVAAAGRFALRPPEIRIFESTQVN